MCYRAIKINPGSCEPCNGKQESWSTAGDYPKYRKEKICFHQDELLASSTGKRDFVYSRNKLHCKTFQWWVSPFFAISGAPHHWLKMLDTRLDLGRFPQYIMCSPPNLISIHHKFPISPCLLKNSVGGILTKNQVICRYVQTTFVKSYFIPRWLFRFLW